MKRWLGFILAFLFIISNIGLAHTTTEHKLAIFFINHVSWQDIERTKAPNISRLAKQGATGLLNVKNYSGYLSSSSYMTMGMSNRTRMDNRSVAAYDVEEFVPGLPGITGGQFYHQLTKNTIPTQGIVVPEISRYRRMAKDIDIEAKPGALGQSLLDNGLNVAVFGNADIPGELHREVALFIMDAFGRVPAGSIGKRMVRTDTRMPLGYTTDYEGIYHRIIAAKDQIHVLVVETGDTSRLEYGSDLFDPNILLEERRKAIKRADSFIGDVIKGFNPNYVLILGANPNRSMIKSGNTGLVPIILDGVGQGLLTSESTRRIGFITSLDLTATIADLMKITAPKGKGFPVTVKPFDYSVQYLLNQQDFYQNLRNVRYNITDSLVILLFTGVLLGLLGLWQGLTPKLTGFYLLLVNTMLLIPIGLIAGGVVGYKQLWLPMAVAFFFSMILAGVLKISSHLRAMTIITLAVPVLLLFDVFTGAQWMMRSAMGSDVIAGGRFYGMGNDLMGVVLGSLTIGMGLLGQAYPGSRSHLNWAAPLLLLLAVIGIGFPKFGANVGGLITALMTMFITVIVLFGIRLSVKKMIGIITGVVVVVLIVAGLDACLNPQPTHAGRAIITLVNQGGLGFTQIVRQKLRILISTINRSTWTWLFALELGAFAIIKLCFRDFFAMLKQEYPFWHKMLLPTGTACLFAFLVNDTGIIPAALIMAYYWLAAFGLYFGRSGEIAIDSNMGIMDKKHQTLQEFYVGK